MKKEIPHGYDAESEYRQVKKGHILGRVDSDEDSDDLKGTSDNPKYGVRGEFTPLEDMADSNGESPLDALLRKEEEKLGAEAVGASVAGDEAELESARKKAEATAGKQPEIRIVTKLTVPTSEGVAEDDDLKTEDTGYEDLENLSTRESSHRAVIRKVGRVFPKVRGRREGLRPPKGAKEKRAEEKRGMSEETVEFFKDIRESEEKERGMIRNASEYVKRNMRKLLNKEKDQQDQL